MRRPRRIGERLEGVELHEHVMHYHAFVVECSSVLDVPGRARSYVDSASWIARSTGDASPSARMGSRGALGKSGG